MRLPELETLVGLFYDSPAALGQFAERPRSRLPATYRKLLAHTRHMTVAVEQFHASPVDVEVVARLKTPTHYARKILLRRRSDGRVVQFGIMRVNFAFLSKPVRAKIESETMPLGRILIEHRVLRRIHLDTLWEVAPGPDLARLFSMRQPVETYGRTALIECDHEPAVELLEIVTPCGDDT